MPCRPLPELRLKVEEFLRLLCEEGACLQRLNRLRPQRLRMKKLKPVVWVPLEQLPPQVVREGMAPFCLYKRLPDAASMYGEWVLMGGIERYVQCTCGRQRLEAGAEAGPEAGAEPPEPVWVDEQDTRCPARCDACRYLITFDVDPEFPLSREEVRAAIDHYFCDHEHEAAESMAPWPLDPKRDGFAWLERLVRASREAEEEPPPGRARLASTVKLEQWMREAENPKHYQPFFAAWLELRRREPKFDEIEDVEKTFKRVAQRCLEWIYGGEK